MNKFNSKLGFILTAVGSAVGMANVWGFPYKFQQGGLVFLLFYIIFVSLFSYVGLSSEFAAGRYAETGTLGAYYNSFKSKNKDNFIGKNIGYIPLLGSLLIAVGYAVIVAYVCKALFDSLTGELMTVDTSVWFDSFSNKEYSVVIFHFLIILITLITCIGGASTIEKSNKIMMPTFFVLFVILAIRILTLDGAIEGYKYMFRFDRNTLNINTIVQAMGQAFFSLSVTGSGMIVCGAYLSKDEDIVSSSKTTGLLDTIAALIASCVIIPAIMVFNMDQAGGPGLLFQVLPTILQNMFLGRLFAIILYLAVILAGISSLQNMFEVVAESLINRFPKIKRSIALVIIGAFVFGIGVNLEMISQWGPFMDIISIYIIPIGASIGAVTWFYILGKDKLIGEINQGSSKKYGDSWYKIGKYIYTPIAIILCLIALIFKVSF
ncbi:sodium-dependent transporter [Anaerococcus prevotii]|uniref:Sodium:neurotransmitter symporter family protein n=1 Tax=Anaerococcus prevotii ACS-065-V-Col13 TaxID=879305 RepID=F0GWX8_9FIRM|nr:sodium-dependent transporter [Anaerococcus prevotii]EGC81638.1 Sodium:neurotransmitter symporter family protein [Anaerococcus prevotii ACS-065-V-Col13]